jgi:hypothetical protein
MDFPLNDRRSQDNEGERFYDLFERKEKKSSSIFISAKFLEF